MRKLILTTCFVLFGLIHTSAYSEDTQISIAVVNVAFLLKNAPEAELASQTLKAEFSPREKTLQEEQERIKSLETERERNKEIWDTEKLRQSERQIRTLDRERTRALEDFREELRFSRDSALDEVQKSVFKAIEEVRIKRNIDIVIQEYVAASERVDMTESVLEHLKAQLKQKQSKKTDNNKKKEK